MNTKDNRRKREKDEAIIRAFFFILNAKKTMSKVTVREICEKAGVNRSTFYAHYQDVYDLLEQVEKAMSNGLTKSFLSQLEAGGNIEKCFQSLFSYIGEYRQFYAVYLNETNKTGVIGLIGLSKELYASRIPNSFWKDMGFLSAEEMAYHEDFALAGLTSMVRRWLNTGCKETPEELCAIFLRHYSSERHKLFQW